LMMIPIHFLPFWWWYPFTSFPFDDDTHSLTSLFDHTHSLLPFWWWYPFTSFPFDDDTHSLLPFWWWYPFTTSLLRIPIHYFPFDDNHFLLSFWWCPFASSLLMIPIFYFPFNEPPFASSPLMIPVHSDDTHWDREGSNSREFFFKSITQETQSVQGGVMGAKETFLSFHHKTRQDRNFGEFCVRQGVFFSCLRTLRTSFLMSWDTKGIFFY
jgi:hypothetical protein